MKAPPGRHRWHPGRLESQPRGAVGIAAAAARTGLTRRALRHYESLGLVHPPTRRGGYFRLYSARDVRRLERIAALRRLLRLTLEQVGSVWARRT